MEKLIFNNDWYVTKSGTESVVEEYQDSNEENAPQAITLPHDGMISELRRKDTKNGGQTGYYPGETYYYSKMFYVSEEWKEKKIVLEFEGIQGLSKISVNGTFVEVSYNGYGNTLIELNDFLKYGENNSIEVRANNEMEQSSRWYTGSGIYRNVNLYVGSQVYFPVYGLKVQPSSINNCGVLDLELVIQNDSFYARKLELSIEIFDKNKTLVTSENYPISLSSRNGEKVNQKLFFKNPRLWSCESPYLYECIVSISDAEKVLDKTSTNFGIRSLTLDPYNGLQINGEEVKLRGTCLHHDNGIIGAVCVESAERRKLEQIKHAGFNSIRSSHNQMSDLSLSICDELGLLVMDELGDAWNHGKNVNDYSNYFSKFWEDDLKKMVDKDYNHPCVIMYSTGNEIREAGTSEGAKLNRAITNRFHELDPNRFVTNGINGILATGEKFFEIISDIMKDLDQNAGQTTSADNGDSGGSNALNSIQAVMVGELADAIATHPTMNDMLTEFTDAMDIAGYNYLTGRHEKEHELYPHRIVLGTETFPGDIANLWSIVKNNPHVIGDFTWTGYDYLGEAGVGIFHYDGQVNFDPHYPDRAAYIGDIDLIGNRRPLSYYREIIYGLRKAPYIAVERVNRFGQESSHTPWMWKDAISSWTWPGFEGKSAKVYVFSDADEIELLLNNESLGRKTVGSNSQNMVEYEIEYYPGELKAVSYRNGKKAEVCQIMTANSSSQLIIEADKAEMKSNGEDLIFAKIYLADEQGQMNPFEKASITLEVEGPCLLAGFGSADPSNEGNYFDHTCDTYDGCVLAVLRSQTEVGECRVKATANGRKDTELTFKIR